MKNWELLTEYNDSLNMGTYNYASPNPPYLTIINHQFIDVDPYEKWGNIKGVLKPSPQDENQERFNNNTSAQDYYNYVLSVYF
jgi:hypothetical protein